MAKNIIMTADKLKKRKKIIKYMQIGVFATMSVMAASFMVLSLIYNGGDFTISLSKNLAASNGIILYNNSVTKTSSMKLSADKLEYMDNISINWIPEDIYQQAEGPHNGDNYIAYTFFVENQGDKSVDYWYTVIIDDVVKDVDTAVRVMIYRNGIKKVYAKVNAETNEPEPGTKKFYSEDVAVLEQAAHFNPGNIDKYTVVIWLEGDDPDCNNNIIGGEIKMHMEITEEGSSEE